MGSRPDALPGGLAFNRSHVCVTQMVERLPAQAARPFAASGLLSLLPPCSRSPPVGRTTALRPSPARTWDKSGDAELAAEVRLLTAGRGIGRSSAPPRSGPRSSARTGARVRQGAQRQSRHLLHDLPPARLRHRRRAEPVDRPGRDRTRARRVHPDGIFIPRNAPPPFNLGSPESLFWDGRVSTGDGASCTRPPAQSRRTMTRPSSSAPCRPCRSSRCCPARRCAPCGKRAGRITDMDPSRSGQALMERLGAIPEYRQMFEAAYPGRVRAR